MNSGIHPLILIAVASGFLAIVAIVIACLSRKGLRLLFISLAILFVIPPAFLFVAFHPELVDGRFRTYKAFYRDIQQGMTKEQVLAVLDRHYPVSGTRQRPKVMNDDAEHLGFFMNPETSREPNCEGIFLTLANGKVTVKTYSPD